MLDRHDLQDLHSSDIPLHILEQDYIQALFLTELYDETDRLVFKGGTFLRHGHGLDRFSQDLDFTATETPPDNFLETCAQNLEDYGVGAYIDNQTEYEHGQSCRLRYEGPLYDGTDRSLGSIEIDISTRDDIVHEPVWTRLFFEYPETRVVNALGLQPEELLAEKLRALSTRTQARDLYDVWFLLQQGIEPQQETFEQKMETVDEEPAITLTVTMEDWDNDLGLLLANPPSFEQIHSDVRQMLSQHGIPMTEQ